MITLDAVTKQRFHSATQTGAAQSGVDAMWTVRGRHDDDARATLNSVHQRQQLGDDSPTPLASHLHAPTDQHSSQARRSRLQDLE